MARRNSMMYKRGVVLCLVFYLFGIIFAMHSWAQTRGPGVKSLAARADARRMIVYLGCLWVGGGGLVGYDMAAGSARHYVTEDGLIANAVFDVAADKKNRLLWVATSNGLARLDLETGQWKSFGTAEGLGDLFVLSLGIYEQQGKTVLFIGTRAGGLYYLLAGSNKISRAAAKEILPDPWVSTIAADPNHHYLWLGTAAGVVRSRWINSKGPLKIDPLPAHDRIAVRRLVVNEQNGDVYCLNYYDEISRYGFSMKRWEIIPPLPGNDIKITDIVLDIAADILWAASHRGIYGYKFKQKEWIRFSEYGGPVSCMTLDEKNSILFYASREGLHSFPEKMKLNKSLVNSPPFNNTVNAIFIDEKSDMIWVGTDWGIARFAKKNQQWKFFDLPVFPGERVTALSVDENTIWFGTMHHGAAKMDRRTGEIEELKGMPEYSTVTSIVGDTDMKKVWFGLLGTRGGVYEYDMEMKVLQAVPGLDGVSVTYLLEDGDWIWVGTGRGVAKFHKMKGPGDDLFDQRLAFGDVLTLALDSKRNRLWITTEHKVIVYDRAQNQCKIFKGGDGFPSSPITSILFDGERIWLGSEGYGLYVYNPDEKVNDPLTRLVGTADRYIISLAHERSSGAVWAGTVSGGISVVKIKRDDR